MSMPAWRAATTTNGTAASFTIAVPASCVAGDYAILAVAVAANVTISATSPGTGTWTVLAQAKNTTTPSYGVALIGKPLTSGDLAHNVTGTLSASGDFCAVLATWSSCTSAVATLGTIGSSTAACALPNAVSSWDSSLIAGFGFITRSTSVGTAWTVPGAFTTRSTNTYSTDLMMIAADQGSTAISAYTSSGTATFTAPFTGSNSFGATVILNPSPLALNAQGSAATISLNLAGNSQPTGLGAAWPQLITEVAFNVGPNATTTPFWTDISDRVLSLSGLTRGQSYELAQPTPGSGSIVLRNNDGAFDSNNTSSPYYPNVLPMRRCRVTAIWNNTSYPVWSGYIRTWPQTWDQSRFGTSNAAVIDAIGTLQGGLLPVIAAAMQGSHPVHLWPLSESLSAPVTGGPNVTWNWTDEGTSPLPLSLAYPASGAGFTATANASLPLWYAADHNLPADSSEGVRVTGSTSQTGPSGTATDGISLFPLSGQIVTWELWGAAYDTGSSFAALLNITSGVTQYLEVLIQCGTNPNLLINYNGGQIATPSFTWLGQAANHIIITVDATPSTPIMVVWVDGFLINVYPLTGTTLPTSAVTGISLVGPYGAATSDAQVMCCAMYQRYLDSAEIAAHILAYPGYPGKTTGNRVSNIFDWANWNGPTSIDTGLSTMQNAVGLGGQTLAAALQQCVNTEFGTLFVDASGNLTFGDRSRLSNTTSIATLGDGTGEIPYLGTIDFGFDPNYVYDRVVVSRNKGSTSTVRTVSTAQQYFPNTLTKTVYSDTDTDASNQATYLASTYSIPRQRVSTITLDPLTAQTWASVLPLEIGNVVTVNARPQGGATISSKFRIQQIAWTWNPTSGVKVTMQISPLLPTPTW